MKAEEMWLAFKSQTANVGDEFSAWQFGAEPDELADLVVKGEKTATCSLFPLYALENEPLPKVGTYHILLDSQDETVCIICITQVSIMKFGEVSADHAFKEGEGDKSYTYWREVHESFFGEEAAEVGIEFTDETEVVCEEFQMVYPQK